MPGRWFVIVCVVLQTACAFHLGEGACVAVGDQQTELPLVLLL